MRKKIRSTDHRQYPEPAIIREAISQLEIEIKAHRADRYLATRLILATAHLRDYLALLEALYLESLDK